MIAEGKITVTLGDSVQIASNRTASVSGLLAGREVGEALALLPMVFSLCGHAHCAAAQLATGQGAADMRLVLAENAREHLLRILLGWQGGGTSMPAPPVMALVADMHEAIENRDTVSVAATLDDYLEAHVFGCPPEDFLAGKSWLGAKTQAAAYLRDIQENGWQALGQTDPAPLPTLPARMLAKRMQEPGFCRYPDWQGTPRETGPFARHAQHPLVAAHGSGLLARLMARLVALALLPAQMRRSTPQDATPPFGMVETARGRLVHMAELEGGRIASYKILAPTEWNFHPEGVAAKALKGLAPAQAKAVIEAIDPCVDFELRAA